MLAYLTRFSCLLDVGSVANDAQALDIYTVLMAENGREDPPAESFLLSLIPEHGATRLWLRDPVTADPQLLITFLTRCAETFALTGTWVSMGRHRFGLRRRRLLRRCPFTRPRHRPHDRVD